MRYVDDWQATRQRFELWWKGCNADRPMLNLVARRAAPLEALEPVPEPAAPDALYLDVDANMKRLRNRCRSRRFMAESFPNLDLNLGPGSMALYLGSEPRFAWDTVWYDESAHSAQDLTLLDYDPDNRWWKTHLDMIRRAVDEASGDFLVNIPDIIENVDILSAMRGPQSFLFDLIDEPDAVREAIKRIDALYFCYYDAFYDAVKAPDGSCSYTAFQIWGPGRTAKVQCDFSAMMSPAQYRELIQPSLRAQCQRLDNSLYHLDGPDAIRHVDALMEIEELSALQWTCGAGKPDGACEKWYPIYDKVTAAGKSLWIQLYDGGVNDWVAGAEKLVRRYGKDALYLHFPEMDEPDAEALLLRAEKNWK